VSASIQPKLVELARNEPQVTVRMQLACSARRLPARQGLPIVHELLLHAEDVDDRYVPLLLWWAIEDKVAADPQLVLGMFEDEKLWQSPIVRRQILERLARRYAAPRSDSGFAACATLLNRARNADERGALVAGMEKGLHGSPLAQIPRPLVDPVARLWNQSPRSASLVRLALRLGSAPARSEALRLASSSPTLVNA